MPLRLALLLGALSLAALPAAALAQGAPPAPQGGGVSHAQDHDHFETLEISYDEPRNLTTLRVSVVGAVPGVDLSASASFLGQMVGALPDSVHLYLTAVGDMAKLRRSRHVELVLDGGSVVVLPNVQVHVRRFSGMTVVQTVGALPAAQFLRMANAEEVQVRYGDLSFYVGPVHMAHFRDFVRHMVPAGSLWSETQRRP